MIDKVQQLKDELEKVIQRNNITPAQLEQFVAFLVQNVINTKKELNLTVEESQRENLRKISEAIQIVSEKHSDALKEVRGLSKEQTSLFKDKLMELNAQLEAIKAMEFKDGDTPVKGVDYFTENEVREIENSVLSKIPKPTELDNREQIVEKINLGGKSKIDASNIKNLPKAINQTIIERGGHAGAMETPLKDATTGKLLNKDSTGAWLVAASGGGGSGTVTDFVFTDGNGFDGTVTNSTTTPTLTLATSVGDNQVIIAQSGALTGSNDLRYDSLNGLISVPGFTASDGLGNFAGMSIYTGGARTFLSLGGNGTVASYLNITSGGGLHTPGDFFIDFDTSALTADRIYTFQDGDGTIAFL